MLGSNLVTAEFVLTWDLEWVTEWAPCWVIHPGAWAACMDSDMIRLDTMVSDILHGVTTACMVTVMTASTEVVMATIHGLTAVRWLL